MTDVVVLHHKIHGLDPNDYAETIRQSRPDLDVVVARTPEEERTYLAEATVATGYQIDSDLVTASETLELFACTFAGIGHLPLEALEAADVTVTNASGVHGPNVAEQVLGYVLSDVRNLRRAWEQKRARRMEPFPRRGTPWVDGNRRGHGTYREGDYRPFQRFRCRNDRCPLHS